MNLIYDMLSIESPDKHPQSVLEDLGITYDSCECWSIRDVWIFYGCNVDVDLPSYLSASR